MEAKKLPLALLKQALGCVERESNDRFQNCVFAHNEVSVYLGNPNSSIGFWPAKNVLGVVVPTITMLVCPEPELTSCG
jgi:hypothetical protein